MPPGFRSTCLLKVIDMGRGTVAQFGETKMGRKKVLGLEIAYPGTVSF